ncbi:MAG: putative DNA-binding protein [Veillonella sp.]|nr:putative DNA-binding protein [Veillonella sp.]
MEERVLMSLLIDFYGALLTERQLQCLVLHHEDDMSLAEIADELGVSRQAVHDNLQRAMQLLHSYEEKLHLVANYERRERLIDQMRKELQAPVVNTAAMQELLAQMEG